MKIKKSSNRKILYFISSYLLIWVLLFEFILPANNILPKPSIVFLSFGDLWEDYNLPVNYISSISAIYISLLAAYFLVRFTIGSILKPNSLFSNFVLSLDWFAEFVPGIAIGLLLVYWFPGSELIEFVFAFSIAFTSMLIKVQKEVKHVPAEYIYSSLSLGVKENIINRYVVWKSVQPPLMKHIFSLHFYLWTILIAFEFIKEGYGLGSVFRTALRFKDLSALFSIFLITGFTIYSGTLILKYLKNKFFFWRNY